MRQQFSCTLFFRYSQEALKELWIAALSRLDFEPRIMYVYVDFYNVLENIPYNHEVLFSALVRGATLIKIRNKAYDEEGSNPWFSMEYDEENSIVAFSWRKENLEFLLGNNQLDMFLERPDFINGICYDTNDAFNQSQKTSTTFTNTDPNDIYNVKKIEHVIDVSKHWGRLETAGGLEFIAAPMMWFGVQFYRIIPRDKLLAFSRSSLIKYPSSEVIFTKLFNLYDSPSSENNRSEQEQFWKFFELDIVVENYRKETDQSISLKERLQKLKKRK
jgi:hypothetical protein